MNNKVIIFGGLGYLGSHICDLLLEKSFLVTSVDYHTNHLNPNITNIELDFFEASDDNMKEIFKQSYKTMIYSVGPDDRTIPLGDASLFFEERLVRIPKKIVSFAKASGVKKVIILGSYFEYFNRLYKHKLEKNHPYIRARANQVKELLLLGEDNLFSIVFLELPYVFGIKNGFKPLWKEHFLDYFASNHIAFIPRRGGTAITSADNVAAAVFAAISSAHNQDVIPICDLNLTYKELLKNMLLSAGMNKSVVSLPAFILSLGTINFRNRLKKEGRSSGLHYGYLMTEIMNKRFFIEEKAYRKILEIDEETLKMNNDLLEVIDLTIKSCY